MKGYKVEHKGTHILLTKEKPGAKPYEVTPTSCTCPARAFRRKDCKHMKWVQEQDFKLLTEADLPASQRLKDGVKKQWDDAFKEHGITDKKEQAWMIDNCIRLVLRHGVMDIPDAHEIYVSGGM
jgi:hypothetical protein